MPPERRDHHAVGRLCPGRSDCCIHPPHPNGAVRRDSGGREITKAVSLPEADRVEIGAIDAHVNRANSMVSGELKPYGKQPSPQASALRPRRQIQVDMRRIGFRNSGRRVFGSMDHGGATLIMAPCLRLRGIRIGVDGTKHRPPTSFQGGFPGHDTPDTLTARVLEHEHRIDPRALRDVADGRIKAAQN
jgi:hypothetical protein